MDNPDGDDNDATIYFIGYQFKMGKNIFAAQYGATSGDPNYDGLTNNAVGDVTDATYYALGVIHKFSKKTRAFIGYRNTDGKDDNTGSSDRDLSVFSAGLRVDF